MATIEVNGRTLKVTHRGKNATLQKLRVEARVTGVQGIGELDRSVRSLYRAYGDIQDAPETRGDVTVKHVQDLANMVEEETGGDVSHLGVYEKQPVKWVDAVDEPSVGDYPAGASDSEKIRWFTDNTAYDVDHIVAALGCSRSLVTEVREE